MKIKEYLLKNKALVIISIIIALGVFLRSYHFSDWLHFELDQSRDAKVIDNALNYGPGYLPLLGPRAGGTFLRLGPIYYYMEYLSALVFGKDPAGMARSVWIFGILSLPLFYYFSRRYFNRLISVLLLTVYSFSLYLVIYSRFGWNPNTVPFFILVIFIALLKVGDKEEKRKGLWLAILAAALSISAQLHFLAMIIFSILVIGFLIYSRPRIALKKWAAAVLVGLVLISPMIINDIKTHGANTKEFFKAITKKSEKHSGSITEKISRNYVEHAAKYVLVLAGKEQNKVLKLKFKNDGYWPTKIDYEKLSLSNIAYQLLGLIFFSSAVFLLFRQFIREKDPKRKNFLVISVMLFIICFLVFTPLALFLSPRFFLVAMPLPLVLLGLGYDYLLQTIKPRKMAIVTLVGINLALLGMNSVSIYYYFKDNAEAISRPVDRETEMVINERTKFTLQQQLMIDDYMKSFYEQNKYPIYISSEAQYQRAILYHLQKADIPAKGSKSLAKSGTIFRQGNYFNIYVTGTNMEDNLKYFVPYFDIAETKSFGSMTLLRLVPKEGSITGERQKVPKGVSKPVLSGASGETSTPKRFLWAEVFMKN